MIIAHHLILNGYGFWLPNDPRGSGSTVLDQEKLKDLGPVHTGRKRVQPPRGKLKRFYRTATPRLDYEPVWFDDAKRQALGDTFAHVVKSRRYTVWACAVLSNHAHLCIRRHRDDALTMWRAIADASRTALRGYSDVPDDHPVWSLRPYKVFLYSPDDVRRIIAYIERNPLKERLAQQTWNFVQPYDGWPHRKTRKDQ
jgi:REP element-mobilizing transposase RayT